jgi:hypothetical protein
MFEWFKSKPKEIRQPYISSFVTGDRVELIWRLYNEGALWMRLSKEDLEADLKDRDLNTAEANFDMFQIVIDRGKTGTVVWTHRHNTTVSFDGFPFDVTVCELALKKLEDK